jgi:hypothetical protein
MGKFFYFGEEVSGYDTRVINEREARAAAGILFLFAIIGFLFAQFRGDFFMTELFSFTFMIEFIIRVLINPKYAPYMIMGRFFVQNQKPEYVGAPQKRFAWAIGVLRGLIMFGFIVFNVQGFERGLLCVICLIFLFAESAFGICLGCLLYNRFSKKDAKYCPGGTCEMTYKEDIQRISLSQLAVVLVFAFTVNAAMPYVENRVFSVEESFEDLEAMDTIYIDCYPPDWTKILGVDNKWKSENCEEED